MSAFRPIEDQRLKDRDPKNSVFRVSVFPNFEEAVLESLLIHLLYYPNRFAHILNYLFSLIDSTSQLNPILFGIQSRTLDLASFSSELIRASQECLQLGLKLFSVGNLKEMLKIFQLQVWEFKNDKEESVDKYVPGTRKKNLLICVYKFSQSQYQLLFKGMEERIEPHFENKNEELLQKALEFTLKALCSEDNLQSLPNDKKLEILREFPKIFKLDQNIEAFTAANSVKIQNVPVSEAKSLIQHPRPLPEVKDFKENDLKPEFDEITDKLEKKPKKENASHQVNENLIDINSDSLILPRICQDCIHNPSPLLSKKICKCSFCVSCCRKMIQHERCLRCNQVFTANHIELVFPYIQP